MTLLSVASEERSSGRFALVGRAQKRQAEHERAMWFRASTPDLDRHGTIVRSEGIETTNFDANPIFGWNHDVYSFAPMEAVIGRVLEHEQDETRFDIHVEFVPSDIHPYGEIGLQMVQAGYLSSVSIGFYAVDAGYEQIDGNEVYVYRRSELLEVSLVAIPANPAAQLLAAGLAKRLTPDGFAPPSLADVGACGALAASAAGWQHRAVFNGRYTGKDRL